MDAIGIIPARYASTRFPGKPLAKILGKSLIQRTYEKAAECQSLAKVVVATDDERILNHVLGFGGEAVMTSVDCPSGTDRLYEVINRYLPYSAFDIIVNIQGDEPCLNPLDLSLLVEKMREDPKVMVSTPISILTDEKDLMNPSIVKCVKDLKGHALYFSRVCIPGSLKKETIHYRHFGLYAYRKEFLKKYAELPPSPLQMAEELEQLKILENGFKIHVVIVEGASIEVNHPEDIQKVEKYLCKQNSFS